MTQFILRYYYFLEDDIESLNRLTETFGKNGLIFIEKNSPLSVTDPNGVYYNLEYPQGKLKILAVKIPLHEDDWDTSLNNLGLWEEENPLVCNDIMGYLTVLAGTDLWEELLKKAASKFSAETAEVIELKNGRLAYLARDRRKDESFYLCGLNDMQTESNTFLLRRMPLLHAGILRLQALDSVLNDRNRSILREKEEMQRELIKILHTKLVMNQASMMAAEELENETQGLATAYGKLVADQHMVVDGLKSLETALLNLEKQINAESSLLNPRVLFDQMTGSYQQRMEDLLSTREELHEVQENYQAAIDVVQSKIQVMNSRTNMATQEQIKGLLEVNTEMQKQGLVYQYAAGLIEFIVLAYYSHTLWSHLQHTAYTLIPSWIQFIVVIAFSGNIVWATHLIAEYKQGEIHVRKKLIVAILLFLLLFTLIIVGSMLTGSHAAQH